MLFTPDARPALKSLGLRKENMESNCTSSGCWLVISPDILPPGAEVLTAPKAAAINAVSGYLGSGLGGQATRGMAAPEL